MTIFTNLSPKHTPIAVDGPIKEVSCQTYTEPHKERFSDRSYKIGAAGGGASHRVQVPLQPPHGSVTQGVSVYARLIRDSAICPLPRGENGWANRDIYFLDGSRRVGRERWRST